MQVRSRGRSTLLRLLVMRINKRRKLTQGACGLCRRSLLSADLLSLQLLVLLVLKLLLVLQVLLLFTFLLLSLHLLPSNKIARRVVHLDGRRRCKRSRIEITDLSLTISIL